MKLKTPDELGNQKQVVLKIPLKVSVECTEALIKRVERIEQNTKAVKLSVLMVLLSAS